MFIEQTSGQNVKIKFDISEKPLLLGDILKITLSGKDGVLAQVIEISSPEKNPHFNAAQTKILFTVEQTGRLTSWQGNVPSQEFRIGKISSEELMLCSRALNPQNPVQIGSLSLYPGTEIELEAAYFENPTVVFCDKETQKNNILNLLSCELSKNERKTILIDFNGDFSDLKVSSILTAGKDIKIPLNIKGLENLYDKTLNDISAETRAIIEGIFIELEDYLSSGEADYIPFSSLIQAVSSVYETSKMAELVLLKNKLYRLQKHGIFADSRKEFKFSNDNVYADLIIYDFSEIPFEWRSEFLEFIVDINSENYKNNKPSAFLLFDLEKIETDKIFVEKICGKASKKGLNPIIISGHESEHAGTLFSFAKNIIAFAPENITKISSLNDYIPRLKENEALVTGKFTNNIPLYVNIFDMEALEEAFADSNSVSSVWSSPEIYLSGEIEEDYYSKPSKTFEDEDNYSENDFNYSGQFDRKDSDVEYISSISNLQEEIYSSQVPQEEQEDEYISYEEQTYNYSSAQNEKEEEEDDDDYNYQSSEDEIILEKEEDDTYSYEEDEETAPGQYNQNYFDDSEEETTSENYEPQHQSNIENYGFEEDEEDENFNNNQSYYEEKPQVSYHSDDSTDDDLNYSNFVTDSEDDEEYTQQTYQNDEDFDYSSAQEDEDESMLDYYSAPDQQQEYKLEEEDDDDADYSEYFSTPQEDEEEPEADYYQPMPQQSGARGQSSPIMPDIPVYEVPGSGVENFDDMVFAEGERVEHEKYGIGTVIKIIGQENKKLCSIQFDEAGRRLLDPRLSGLRKF